MRIEHIKQLGGTPEMGLVAQIWGDMMRAGQTNDTTQMVAWDNCAVVARDEQTGVLMGVITYNKSDWIKSYLILLGFVVREHRGSGVYRALWEALVAKAQEEEIREIIGSTKINNRIMREVAKKLGRVEESVNLRFEVPPK